MVSPDVVLRSVLRFYLRRIPPYPCSSRGRSTKQKKTTTRQAFSLSYRKDGLLSAPVTLREGDPSLSHASRPFATDLHECRFLLSLC